MRPWSEIFIEKKNILRHLCVGPCVVMTRVGDSPFHSLTISKSDILETNCSSIASWTRVFPWTLDLCRGQDTRYSPWGVYDGILPPRKVSAV